MRTSPYFYKSKLLFTNFKEFLENNIQEFGDSYQYRGLINFYFIQDRLDVKKVLLATNKSFSKKTPLVKNFHNIIGESILLSDQEVWKPRRRLLNPSFTKENSLSFISLIKVKVSETIDEINQNLYDNKEKEIDLSPVFNRLILNIIGAAFFDQNFNNNYSEIETLLDGLRFYIEKPPFPVLSNPNVPTWRNIRMKKGRKKLLDFVQQFLTLILAGHETTANALCHVIYLLTQNQDKYKILQSEIDEKLDADTNLSVSKIMEFPFLDAVIKESMRLLPPVWALNRRTLEEYKIQDTRLGKNSTVLFSPLFIHTDQRLWDRPKAFFPERFLPENKNNIYPDSYLPFGAGQRACIGAHLAIVEMKITLAMLLREFHFSKIDGYTPDLIYSITIFSKNGFRFNIKKRTT